MVELAQNDGSQKSTGLILWVFFLGIASLGFYFYKSVNSPVPDQNPIPIPEKPLYPDITLVEAGPPTVDDIKQIDEKAQGTSFFLPDLDKSDSLVRQIAPSAASHPRFVSWLAPDQIIRTFTLLVDNMSRGDLVRKHLKQFEPKQAFKAREIADGVYLTDQASFHRFDRFVEVFDSLNPRIAAALYLKLQPLFQEAYEELGYPGQDFNQVLFAAADVLLDAPVVNRTLKFERPSVMFKFADKKLENLNDVQKQMIRMGPKNTKRIQAKTRAFVKLLREAGA